MYQTFERIYTPPCPGEYSCAALNVRRSQCRCFDNTLLMDALEDPRVQKRHITAPPPPLPPRETANKENESMNPIQELIQMAQNVQAVTQPRPRQYPVVRSASPGQLDPIGTYYRRNIPASACTGAAVPGTMPMPIWTKGSGHTTRADTHLRALIHIY